MYTLERSHGSPIRVVSDSARWIISSIPSWGVRLFSSVGQTWTTGARLSETVNDIDGMVVNFWRSIRADPESVAHFADWPMQESEMHARHAWLVGKVDSVTQKLEGSPNWYNARIAGYWAYGMACWLGTGFCSGDGPWISGGGAGRGHDPRQQE